MVKVRTLIIAFPIGIMLQKMELMRFCSIAVLQIVISFGLAIIEIMFKYGIALIKERQIQVKDL